jgi:hypothetical protein
MVSERLKVLLSSLAEATSDGQVAWAETSSAGRFRVSLSRAHLEIEEESTPSDEHVRKELGRKTSPNTYVVYIMGPSTSRAAEVEFFDPTDPDYDLVRSLYMAARNQALKIDDAIESMIGEVEKKVGKQSSFN